MLPSTRRKKVAAKQANATEELMAMLAQHTGADVQELKKTVKVPDAVEENPFSTETMQKELCLEFISHPGRYMSRKCKRCGDFFGTSYRSVAYCSDLCRSIEFEESMGVPYNPTGKPQVEVWGGEPPRIIKPILWKNLASLLEILRPVIENSEPPVISEASEPEVSDPLPQKNSSQTIPDVSTDPVEDLQWDEELPVFEF